MCFNNWSNQKNVNNKSCSPQLLLNKGLFQEKKSDFENEKFANFDRFLTILDKENTEGSFLIQSFKLDFTLDAKHKIQIMSGL